MNWETKVIFIRFISHPHVHTILRRLVTTLNDVSIGSTKCEIYPFFSVFFVVFNSLCKKYSYPTLILWPNLGKCGEI